eukprot:11190533-Lingulodinium_polyedra.AAC.1
MHAVALHSAGGGYVRPQRACIINARRPLRHHSRDHILTASSGHAHVLINILTFELYRPAQRTR